MINKPNQRYEATKRILYKGNQGGYIRVPNWLQEKTVTYKLEGGMVNIKKLVGKNCTLNFPKLLIGTRLFISYNHNHEDF